MLAKLALVLKGKALATALGLLLVGGGGTAVAVAAQTHTGPFAPSPAASTHNGKGDSQANGNHAHTVAIEGVLLSYDSTAHTIGVQKNGETSTTTITVDSKTEVNGDHATSLADLAHSLKHHVQVQSDKQSDGSFLAWKITVGGMANPNGDNGNNSGGGNNSDNGNIGQHPVVGTVVSVNITASSFVLKESDGTKVTVTISKTTTFQGGAHSLADLKANTHVTVRGTSQTAGTIAATSIEIGGAPSA